jgi:hypothetical protein
VLRVDVEGWLPENTDKDLELTNRHIYDTVKQANALVLGSVPLKPSEPTRKMLSFAGHPIGAVKGVHF